MSKRRSVQMPRGDRGPSQAEQIERARRLVAEGAHLLTSRRIAEAELLLSEAWEIDPNSVEAAINLGGAYILQGKHKRAVPVLEAATKLDPNNPMVWVNLAAAYLGKLPFAQHEAQDNAIGAFERALVLDPGTPHVHYNLGLIYLERNDPYQAALSFRSALDTDPFDSDARSYLEKIESQRGSADE